MYLHNSLQKEIIIVEIYLNVINFERTSEVLPRAHLTSQKRSTD